MTSTFSGNSLTQELENKSDHVQPHICGSKAYACKKTCGSIGCKRDILSQRCIGIKKDRCTASVFLSEADLTKAMAWINGNGGDMKWLIKDDSRGTGAPIKKNRPYRAPQNLHDPQLTHLASGRVDFD